MATEDTDTATAPKRSGFGWIPKLSLLAVVVAFGYLYLSSVDRDTVGDTPQATLADESGVEADGFRKFVDKLGEFSASAETVIADVTAAGTDGFNKVVDTVKDLTGSAETETETAETLASDATPTEVAKTEPVADRAAIVEASAVSQDAAAAPAPTPLPTPLPTQAAEDRPVAAAFDRHSAPLPAARAASPEPSSEPRSEPRSEQVSEATLEGTAPAASTTASSPMKDAEATVFAESLMGGKSPAEPASVSAEVDDPVSAPIPQVFAPVPVVPQPFAPAENAPAPSMAAPGAPAFDRRQENAAQYRARMMAEYENMRRAADQRAREYWERMQVPGPMAAPMGYPAYGPGYAPLYGAPPYPR